MPQVSEGSLRSAKTAKGMDCLSGRRNWKPQDFSQESGVRQGREEPVEKMSASRSFSGPETEQRTQLATTETKPGAHRTAEVSYSTA